jgi:hypothetical protein
MAFVYDKVLRRGKIEQLPLKVSGQPTGLLNKSIICYTKSQQMIKNNENLLTKINNYDKQTVKVIL